MAGPGHGNILGVQSGLRPEGTKTSKHFQSFPHFLEVFKGVGEGEKKKTEILVALAFVSLSVIAKVSLSKHSKRRRAVTRETENEKLSFFLKTSHHQFTAKFKLLTIFPSMGPFRVLEEHMSF